MPSGSQAQAFLWEAILTFFLLFVILAVAREPGSDLRPALEPDGSEPWFMSFGPPRATGQADSLQAEPLEHRLVPAPLR
jgi:glycerol uptake facilitator-like aquaporin